MNGVYQADRPTKMKTDRLLPTIFACALLVGSSASGQTLRPVLIDGTPESPPGPAIDLDFPGGSPKELVAAINKHLPESDRLNVVIPSDAGPVQIPELRMKGVTVPALFEALSAASESRREETGVAYGFRRTQANPPAWWFSFWDHRPPTEAGGARAPEPVCRFFPLGSFLDPYSIEDITTAIRTGYDMLGEQPPEMKFHPETSLLIAVGPAAQLQLIDNALAALATTPRNIDPVTGQVIPGRPNPRIRKLPTATPRPPAPLPADIPGPAPH